VAKEIVFAAKSACVGLTALLMMATCDGAAAAECVRKTAGFFLEDMNANVPHNVAPSLASIPVSLTGGLGDPGRGREVLVSAQKGDCLTCHKVSALSSIEGQGGIGPSLDTAGSKYTDAQLRQILVDPKTYFPNTIMPSYFNGKGGAEPSVLTAGEVEDLIAYMKTLK
jgi:sulfur-oxidizing protein SoxX